MSDLSIRHLDLPRWDLRVIEAADLRVVLLAALGGVAFDAGIRSGVVTAGGTLAVLVAGGVLLASGRLATSASRMCVGAAMAIAPFLSIRTSPWLVPLDLLAIAGLLVLSGALARDGRLTDLPMRLVAGRAVVAAGHGLAAIAFLAEPLVASLARRRGASPGAGAVVRGILITVPVVLLLGALLASADAVFASALDLRLPLPEDLAAHGALIVLGALAIGGVLRTASGAPGEAFAPIVARLGTVEWTILLSSLVALFAAFATAQAITLSGGARHVLETEGLTYAEYARHGYVQLLAVAGLTGFVLAALRAVADRSTARRRFAILSELTVLLTGVVLVVAVRRLGLYEDAYGWTMLRLMAKAGAVWLGAVLVLLAARLAEVMPGRDWFPAAAVTIGIAVVVALNVLNPEAAVARHNLRHAQHELDPQYLAALSDDAVPTVAAALPSLPPETRATICSAPPANDGPLAWNHATRAADAARARWCR